MKLDLSAKNKGKWATLSIPKWMHDALKLWAKESHRSVPKELEALVSESNRTLPVNFKK